MTKTAAAILSVLVACAVWGGGGRAWAADDDLIQVFIDARDPAYVIFQGVAENTHPAARQEMEGYATLDKVSLVAWATFRDNAERLVSAGIVKAEYPPARTARGILALLKINPGRPFAITWNGGIAASFWDYQLAVELLESYQEDQARYERERRENVDGDPLNPELHLKDLQGG